MVSHISVRRRSRATNRRTEHSKARLLSIGVILTLLVPVSGPSSAQMRDVATFMVETAKLTASDGASGDQFGSSVSISGDTLVVGAHGDDDSGDNSGSAYFSDKPGTGWDDMTETAKGIASDGAADCESFGWSVSNSGEAAVVGCWENAAYVFLRFEPIAWVYLPVVLRSAP